MQTLECTRLYDIPALELARFIIEKDPASHIHVPMLAGKARINEFKLKIGFRELFLTSPINTACYLAKELLEETDDTIDQIEVKVGFDAYNGFSSAFKRHFAFLQQLAKTGKQPDSLSQNMLYLHIN